ncbi:MAG TPA: methyltransferase domain-containing protein [Ktedonosporobacter sp.]|jgi:ubiquinone/menaquinone biosynthesis C-methylase UbiE|nr:methyltransferase domain-containing protein [Ktedonosporobacter sp.]
MKKQVSRKAQTDQYLLRCDVLPGLKPFACQEIKNRYRSQAILHSSDDPASIYFRYTGTLHELFFLRTVVAIYLVRQFPIPRPRALLGHQHYQLLLQGVKEVRLLHAPEAFSGLRISAAGENSSVFSQLKAQLSRDTGLPASDEGDLLIRVYPASGASSGWEVLIRLTPRPLSTRPWRVFNMKGALNATVAAAMIEMAHPSPDDRLLNLMCGSGTLLVERLQRCPAAIAVGCDTNTEALRGAQLNLERGGVASNALLFASDATDLPFLPGTFTVLYADVPWGQLTGSHEANKTLYPQLLSEAARLAAPDARFTLLTHEITLFEEVLKQFSNMWQVQEVVKIFQGGLHPRIYVLQRTGAV